MGLFDFFRKSKPAHTGLPPRGVVEVDDEVITYRRPPSLVERVRWDELAAVLIDTTGLGPVQDDFFWFLLGNGMKSGCRIPSEAEGCGILLERLQRLPGFDNKMVIRASQCFEEESFLCWEIDLVAEVIAKLEKPLELSESMRRRSLPLREALGHISEVGVIRIGIDHEAFKLRFAVDDIGAEIVTLPDSSGASLARLISDIASQVRGAWIMGPGFVSVTTPNHAGVPK